ncbi:MAG: DUF4956 domain-containing protein [Saprospiraceae bacterium]
MQDFFSTYSRIENPTWDMMLFSFVLSFLLSGLVAFTYNKTTKNEIQPVGMLHALIGGPLIATMILQSIGDNIASGLGMLGALTIVRYRTNLNSPRDAVFIFAALGIGISCGLFGFLIALFGTIMFCLLSFVVFMSPFHFAKKKSWEVKIKSEELVRLSAEFIDGMNEYCGYWNLRSLTTEKPSTVNPANPNTYLYLYSIQFKSEEKQQDFLKMLRVLNISLVFLKKDK